jgi:hypothetical protein
LGKHVLLAVPLLVLTVLLAWQPAYAHVGPTLYAGHYNLLLQAQGQTDSQGKIVNKLLQSLPKLMTLDVIVGSTSATFRFSWTHISGKGVDPSHFLFVMGFDLDNDTLWEDGDTNKYTIDDTLVLSYLGYDIVTPPPCWVCINLLHGLRVISYQSSDTSFQVIYSPEGPNTPGPQDPNGNSLLFSSSAKRLAFFYTLTFTVPLVVFLSMTAKTGFGFGLLQETGFPDKSKQNILWVWPPQRLGTDLVGKIGNPDGAGLLGDLILSKPPK